MLLVRIALAIVGFGLLARLVREPLALDRVEIETDLARVLSAATTTVSDPYLRGVTVGDLGELRAVRDDLGGQLSRPGAVLAKAVGRLQLEAGPATLLLV